MRTPILAAIAVATLGAAVPNPVTWKLQDAPAKPVKAGGRFTVNVVAQIEEGWHLYSMKPLPDGPIPTRVWLPEGQPFRLAGEIKAPAPQTLQDPNFNMEVEFYEGRTVFSVPVLAASGAQADPRSMEVSASYQACNDKLCLPPRTVKIVVERDAGK